MLEVVTRQAAGRHRRRARQRRVLAAASVVVAVASVAGAVLLTAGDDSDRVSSGRASVGPPATFDRDPLTEPEGWLAMADSPLSGRAGPVTAWTGSEMLIWRGDGAFNDGGGGEPGRTDGAAYDPANDSWRPMADSPLPEPGNAIHASDYASAWTGHELLVWGGPGPEAAAYDPETDSWRSIDPGPLGTRNQFAFTWTGTELVIIGGYVPILERDEPFDPEASEHQDAAAYDPTTDSWRPLPDTGIRRTGEAVWTGSEVLLLASSADPDGGPALGLALDPAGGPWRRIAQPPMSRFDAPPVWTGTEVVTAGASVRTDPDVPNQGAAHAGTATYDPATDTWTVIDPPADVRVDRLRAPSALWSGREVLLIGAPGFGGPATEAVRGAAFDPRAGTWRTLPEPGLSNRGAMASVWTGTELIVWGGAYFTGFTSEPQSDGMRYRPGPGR
jgi:hypothetical protein